MESKVINNFENISDQVKQLKLRLDNLDKTLTLQEEILDTLFENTNSLLNEALLSNKSADSVQEIMKGAFSKGVLPKILQK